MFAAIWDTVKNIVSAGTNTRRLAELERIVHELVAAKRGDDNTTRSILAQLQDHERRILYLEMWKECQGDCGQKIKDLKDVQENQRIRVRNLEQRILTELFPSLEKLKAVATTQEELKEVQGMRNQVKTHLTRAKNLVGLN